MTSFMNEALYSTLIKKNRSAMRICGLMASFIHWVEVL